MINSIVQNDIAQSFSQAAKSYDQSAFFQRIAGERLMERLDYFKLTPKHILDLGCGTGYFSRQLTKRYPDAQVTGVDFAQGMVQWCQQQSQSETYLCADACQLPFESNSVDLIFSNLTFQWIEDLPQLFHELNRVIKPNGLLLFTTLGPDTLYELKQSWAAVDDYKHVNNFLDMHHVGDAMLSAKMLDPVVDSEPVVIGYQRVTELMRDLKNIGAHNLDQKRKSGLTSPRQLKQLEQHYQQFKLEDGQLPATYELVYGHAFATEHQAASGYHEYLLDLIEQQA
ncbi:MAG: malonyl-ACP O-methyltransferase BioC [Kangiellaceae bacterium]|nr:malonyl-ACP O-methyltransferase BioC [Kangiellaceae bacterium]